MRAAEWGRGRPQQQASGGVGLLEGTPLESLGLKTLLFLHYALPPTTTSPTSTSSPRWPAAAAPTKGGGKGPTAVTAVAATGPRAFPSGKPLPPAEAALALGGRGRLSRCVCVGGVSAVVGVARLVHISPISNPN